MDRMIKSEYFDAETGETVYEYYTDEEAIEIQRKMAEEKLLLENIDKEKEKELERLPNLETKVDSLENDINDTAEMTAYALEDISTTAELVSYSLEDSTVTAEMLAYALEKIEELEQKIKVLEEGVV